MSEPKYVGIPIFFNGKTHLVPSLSVLQFQQHYDLLAHPLQGEDKESVEKRFKAYIPLIGVAIRRNYPEITDDQLYAELDLHTFSVCLQAVQNASGMKAVRPGEENQPAN